jgi:tetratricopeptide (TPR) repeat protein
MAPKNARALLLKGQIEDETEDFENAEKDYKASTEADPTLSWPWLYLAELYDEVLDKPVDALNAYRKYLELGGPDPDGVVKASVDALAKETGK